MATVRFQISSDTPRYWLAVDDRDIEVDNDAASVSLSSGEHVLYWHTVGNSGDAISIVGKSGGTEVVNVKSSVIPDDSNKGAGYRRFEV